MTLNIIPPTMRARHHESGGSRVPTHVPSLDSEVISHMRYTTLNFLSDLCGGLLIALIFFVFFFVME